MENEFLFKIYAKKSIEHFSEFTSSINTGKRINYIHHILAKEYHMINMI